MERRYGAAGRPPSAKFGRSAPRVDRPAYTTAFQTTVSSSGWGRSGCSAREEGRRGEFPYLRSNSVSRALLTEELIDDLLAMFGGRTRPLMARCSRICADSHSPTCKGLKRLFAADMRGRRLRPMMPAKLSRLMDGKPGTGGRGDHLWQSTLVLLVQSRCWLLL